MKARRGAVAVVGAAILIPCCGSPSPAPAPTKTPDAKAPAVEPAKDPRIDPEASPELAVAITAAGTVAIDGTGRTVVLSSEKAIACRVDPRAGVLWMRSPTDPEHGVSLIGPLVALDLRNVAPPVTVLPTVPNTFVIAYPDEELGRKEPHTFVDGVIVHMSDPPRVEALVGCDGDMVWACFDETDDPEDEAKMLARRKRAHAKSLAEQPLAVAELTTWAARGKAGRATPSGPGIVDAPRKLPVPAEACEEIPENCGTAKVLPGGRVWLVAVSNTRGDFFYEDYALYDPKTDELFDPAEPTRRHKPSEPWKEATFTPEWISPSGELAMGSGMLVRLEGGVIARDLQQTCGFWGGSWEL